MLDLKSAILPSAVEVDGKFYKIHTDFRFWLIFFDKFRQNQKCFYTDFDFVYLDDKPTDRQKGFEALSNFASPKNELPRNLETKSTKILDYNIDSDLIFSAFYEQYKIDLFDEKLRLHWHKFLALLNGLHDTKLNEIMSYRSYDENDKTDFKANMIKARKMWELAEEIKLTEEEERLKAEFESHFKD